MNKQPEQAQKQEPVAWLWKYNDGDEEATLLDPQYFSLATLGIASTIPLYTSPPQRQPLTDEQLFKLWDEDMSCDMPDTFKQFKHTARAIEAAHGIKGEA